MSEVRLTVTGHLTAPPEIVQVGNSTKAKFTIATNPSIFKDGAWQKLPPVFTPCEAWVRTAESVAGLGKGTLLLVTGVMRADEYEGKDGTQKRFQYLRVEEVAVHTDNRAAANGQGMGTSASFSRPGADYTPSSGDSSSWGVNPSQNAEFGGWGQP